MQAAYYYAHTTVELLGLCLASTPLLHITRAFPGNKIFPCLDRGTEGNWGIPILPQGGTSGE